MQALKALREKQMHGLTMIEAIKNLSRYEIRTPFIISTCIFISVMFSGPFAIIFYAVDIFKKAGVTTNEHLAAIITALVRIGGGILGIFLIQRFPRVKLAMVSLTIMSVCMVGLGTIIHLKHQEVGEEMRVLNNLPILLVTVYMFSYGAGNHGLKLMLHEIQAFICRSRSTAVGVTWRVVATRLQGETVRHGGI